MSGANSVPGSSRVRKSQAFTSSGTWTPPAAATYVEVWVIGGGGGGQSGSDGSGGRQAGTAGGDSSFGALATSSGASGGPTGTTGFQKGQPGIPATAFSAYTGIVANAGGMASAGFLGQWGAGGAGGGQFRSNVASGTTYASGAAGYSSIPTFYTGSVTGAQTVTVGAKGVGGAAIGFEPGEGQAGQDGTQGIVIVTWLE